MFIIFISVLFIVTIVWVFSFDYFSKYTRFSFMKSFFFKSLSEVLNYKASFWVVFILFVLMFMTNVLGNIPLRNIPTLFYSQTLTLSLLFWIPLMICVFLSQFKSFVAHILPYGSPLGLILFLPLVEIFSQIIRPFTLIIRLRTNLSSGHIMLYMFSYFTLLSEVLSRFILVFIFVLFVLEIFISMLQAYIFVTLISLYVAETV